MVIICDVSKTLKICLHHIPNFKGLCKYILVILTLASHIYSVAIQCCGTLHQAVTSQAEDRILLKGVLIVSMTEYMFTFDVLKMNYSILC